MRARSTTRTLLGAACGALLVGVSPGARAAPTLRAQVSQSGDFLLIGNTLGQDCGAGIPKPVVGTIGDCGGTNTADTAPDVLWSSDTPLSGQAFADSSNGAGRTTAVLALPPSAQVTHAYLYW